MRVFADLVNGEVDAADILFLAAAVIFGIVAILRWVAKPSAPDGILMAVGLCVVSIAWLLL